MASTASGGGITRSQVDISIATALTYYTTTSSLTTLWSNKQNSIDNNNTSHTELFTSNTLRRLRAGSNITLSIVDGDVSIASTASGGVPQSQVDNSISTALTDYSTTTSINTL